MVLVFVAHLAKQRRHFEELGWLLHIDNHSCTKPFVSFSTRRGKYLSWGGQRNAFKPVFCLNSSGSTFSFGKSDILINFQFNLYQINLRLMALRLVKQSKTLFSEL